MSESPRVSPWYLQPRDQGTLAVVAAVALVAIGGYWLLGVWRHGWIEIDTAPRGEIAFRVDVNSAQWPELAQLPGIGETLARRMVERRETVGRYHQADDLLKVQGIGKKTLENIRPHLVFPPAETAPKP